jgi:voltage-gated potassium channel Kch
MEDGSLSVNILILVPLSIRKASQTREASTGGKSRDDIGIRFGPLETTMFGVLFFIVIFGRTMWLLLTDATFRSLVLTSALVLACGTSFYHFVEGWSFLDSLYFSVVSLTTVGYGDLSPTTSVAKVFTIGYLLSGVALLMGFINAAAALRRERFIERHREPAQAEADGQE